MTSTAFDQAIAEHGGRVIRTRSDEAYVFVTVQFPGHSERQAFLRSLPRGTSWERGDDITVELDIPRHVPAPWSFGAKS